MKAAATTSRNQPCPCGSGKKYKHCCAKGTEKVRSIAGELTSIQLETGQVVPLARAMEHALQLHQARRIRKAEAIYKEIVEKLPDHADAQHLLGVTYHQTGRQDLAYTHIGKAISLNSSAALFHNNLGEVCRALNRLDEARACYAKALSLQPDLLEAHRNIGLTLLAQNEADQAITYLQKTVDRHPDYLGGYWALAMIYVSQKMNKEALEICERGLERNSIDLSLLLAKGRILQAGGNLEPAVQHYRRAIQRLPQSHELYHGLLHVLKEQGDTDGAIDCLKNELRLRPNDQTALHLLAALQNDITDRAPATYVRELFDEYADNFDQHLVAKLEYQTPALLARTLEHALGEDVRRLSILDMGCGTGLLGEEIRKLKKDLVGIDLSPRMIEKSRARGIYDDLIVGDLLEYLGQVKVGRFDLIAASDVFIYVGDLSPVFTEASRILAPGSWFTFSLEAAHQNDDKYVLVSSGRYQHGLTYIKQLCLEHAFEIQTFSQPFIRKEFDQPVAGYLFLLRRTAKKSA